MIEGATRTLNCTLNFLACLVMKGLLAAFFWAFSLCLAHGRLIAPIQSADLALGSDFTLLDVFNAGIRPYRVSVNRCEIDGAHLSFAFPDGKSSGAVDVRHVSFAVDRRDRIRRIDMRTPAVSVQEAVEVLNRLGAALGMTLAGLEQAIARATPNNPNWSDPWTQDWKNSWADARLGLEPMTYFSNDASTGHRNMRAIVHFTFEWKSSEVGPTYRREPIQPPKGYEHVSMEIPTQELLERVQGSTDPAYAHLQIKTDAESVPDRSRARQTP